MTCCRTLRCAALLGLLPLLLFGLTACEPVPVVTQSLLGEVAPAFRLPTSEGVETSLEELMGPQLTLIDFWATWCAPCIAELPSLHALANQYRHRGVSVVGVLCDDNVEEIGPPFLRERGLSYPNLLGDASVQDDYEIQGFPTLVLLDAEGKVLRRNQGAVPREVLQAWIEEALPAVAEGGA